MKGFENKAKLGFLDSLPKASLDLPSDSLARRCKFNFSYFEVQRDAGQDFCNWDASKLSEFIVKLKGFSKESLSHWQQEPIGQGSGRVLSIYGAFPANSSFSHPKAVPHQVRWGRFRLNSACRLCGFVVPKEYGNTTHACGHTFDCNTFYIVFLDEKHEFYQSKD